MNLLRKLVFILISIFSTHSISAQVYKVLRKLPIVESGNWRSSSLTDHEKLARLAYLPPGDSVQFELPNYDPEEADPNDVRYFPLELSGLHYFDLDFDGDLDILYTGASGWQTLRDTKVYLFDKNQYTLLKILNGSIIDIQPQKDRWIINTQWIPCCDSYTSRIEIYSFSKKEQGEFMESISCIGLYLESKGMPDFSKLKTAAITDADVFASPDDFYRTTPYFGDRNKELRDSLQAGYYIRMLHLPGRVRVNILDKTEERGQTWYLVITEAVSNVPKSLYEWSEGDGRRFIGWVKAVD